MYHSSLIAAEQSYGTMKENFIMEVGISIAQAKEKKMAGDMIIRQESTPTQGRSLKINEMAMA